MATLDASSSRMAALDVSSEDESSPSARAWRWYASMGSPKRVLAPMVGQSELAFRQLVRRYGCDLAVTPMVHARMFATCDRYRADVLRDLGDAEDRPLLVQFCGDDKDYLLEAAAACAPFCDGVDLNLGCPQGIARRGHYGAFLLEEPDLVCGIVEHLSTRLPVPVTVKIRLLSPTDAAPTIALAKRLVAAGASLLTLHGRTKEMKGQAVGERAGVSSEVFAAPGSVPLIANGGMEAPGDLERCAAFTGADGAMASEGALEDPCIFGVASRSPVDLADEYLAICRSKAPQLAFAKGHLHKLLFEKLQARADEKARRDAEEAARQEALDDAADDGGGLGGLFGDEDE
ncbi:dihydrouridine synthase [Aureococcus anophagefferens]|nr:dihydrouridine synthase [Aureococcus anophagefferens]